MLDRVLQNIFRRLEAIEHAINQNGSRIVAAIDDLKTAVDNAVAEMQAAADFIKNHPATNNDPTLTDFTQRLQTTADSLHNVDQPPTP